MRRAWDQKDAKFFEESIASFEGEVAALQRDGLTQQDRMKYTLEKIKDKEIKNDINELSKIIDDSQMSEQEARDFVITKLNSTYSHGASWSGSRMGMRTPCIIAAIIIIMLVVHHNSHHPKPVVVREKPVDYSCCFTRWEPFCANSNVW